MQTIPATQAKQRFAELIDMAQTRPIAIQRHDRTVAVIVSPDDYDALRRMRGLELLEITRKISAEAKAKGMTEEILKELLAEES